VEVVNLRDKFSRIHDYWNPRIAGELNESYVKLVKLKGEFVWHHHEAEDELCLVVEGRLRMRLRDGHRDIGSGEFFIVPRGVEHCPLALTDEVHVVLLEPRTTVNRDRRGRADREAGGADLAAGGAPPPDGGPCGRVSAASAVPWRRPASGRRRGRASA
jgi:mannose-6-phosphate isomerase-like protein (cupin superfamily)